MIEISKTKVMNFEGAIRGARNPLNSWEKSDSFYDNNENYILGDNDLKLASKLCKAGSDHRKFMRQIIVSTDISAPLYWWKEFDTYKVGTVANSTSTMHKIHSKPLDMSDFSHDEMSSDAIEFLRTIVDFLEMKRLNYVSNQLKIDWNDIIHLLPSSYNQTRTCTLNYEVLLNIYHSRLHHKLSEWHKLCNWIEELPYAKYLITMRE